MKYYALAVSTLLFVGCSAPQPPVPQQQIQAAPCLTGIQLNNYSYDNLTKVATALRKDVKDMNDFSLFINNMKSSMDSYSNMIKSSTYISNAIRLLPVPYAGEVSSATRVISTTIVNLNVAATSLDRYQKSSTAFLEAFDKLDRNNLKSIDLVKLSLYADTQVLNDASALENSLHRISTSTALLAATAQSVSDAMNTTGQYVNSAKGLIGLSETESSDKVKIDASRDTLKDRLAQLSKKIASLESTAQNNRYNIAKARTYAELGSQLQANQ